MQEKFERFEKLSDNLFIGITSNEMMNRNIFGIFFRNYDERYGGEGLEMWNEGQSNWTRRKKFNFQAIIS